MLNWEFIDLSGGAAHFADGSGGARFATSCCECGVRGWTGQIGQNVIRNGRHPGGGEESITFF